MTAGAFLSRMFMVNLVLAAAAALVCMLLSGGPMAIAAGTAGLAGSVNLLLLGLLVIRVLTPGARRLAALALLVLKLLVLAGLVVLVTAALDLDAVGLAAGFSSTVVAVLLASAYAGLSGRDIVL